MGMVRAQCWKRIKNDHLSEKDEGKGAVTTETMSKEFTVGVDEVFVVYFV